jgi:hypothetical protein
VRERDRDRERDGIAVVRIEYLYIDHSCNILTMYIKVRHGNIYIEIGHCNIAVYITRSLAKQAEMEAAILRQKQQKAEREAMITRSAVYITSEILKEVLDQETRNLSTAEMRYTVGG